MLHNTIVKTYESRFGYGILIALVFYYISIFHIT